MTHPRDYYSDWFIRERTAIGMAKALRGCPDLSIKASRRFHYRREDFTDEQIAACDSKAVFYAEQYLKLNPQKQMTLRGILARMTAGSSAVAAIYFIWIATPSGSLLS